MTETVERKIARGGHRAAERQAEDKANRKSSSFNRDWKYFTLKAAKPGEVYGESAVLRFVTDEDEWVDAKQHSFIPTKDKPADYPSGPEARPWKDKGDAVCRYTEDGGDPENDIPSRPLYDDCFICDHIKVPGKGKLEGKMVKPYASPKLWAVAVVRRPVLGTKEHLAAGLIEDFQVGKPAFYEDELIEKEDGTKVKQFVVLNFSMSNFFDALLGFHQVYGTVLDRDFRITRKGASTDTTYDIVPLDPQPGADGKKIDLRREPYKTEYAVPFSLSQIVLDKASDKHYQWYFDDTVVSSYEERFGKKDKDSEESSSDAGAEESAPEASKPNAAVIDGMRDRLKASRKSND